MKKIVCFLLIIIVLAGCSQTNSGDKSELVEPLKKENVSVIAQAQDGNYSIGIKAHDYEEITDELSPYNGMYHGLFTIEVKTDSGISDSCEIVFNKETNLYFPKNFRLSLQDYNGDGDVDFALGQRISSTAMEYQFYTMDKHGKIRQMKLNDEGNSIITDGQEGFDAAFDTKEGMIVYQEYHQDTGKSKTKFLTP